MEIERKFRLAAKPLVLHGGPGMDIQQGYVLSHPGELRARREGRCCLLTIKGDGTVARNEWERSIPEWAFDILWAQTDGYRIHKTRYDLGHRVVVDVYHGPLEGLVILEVEFDTLEQAQQFRLPGWATGALDVTEDKAYKNKALATLTTCPA